MEAFFIYLLKSAGIVTIFFISYKLWLQKETFFSVNRHYLLAGILTSLFIPVVVFTSYNYIDPLPIESIGYTDIPITLNNNITLEKSASFDWYALLFKIYFIGVFLTSIQFLVQLLSLIRLLKSGTIATSQNFKLVQVKKDIAPFSFFNYIVYNPSNFSQDELDIILNHEKAHARQYHTLDILISQLFLIFQWFNPLVWLYRKSIHQNLEFLADKVAINKIPSKKHYQHTLLKATIGSYNLSITNNFYNSLIKKRIIMLNQSSSKKRNIWKYGVILPVLALFIMSFNTKTIDIVRETKENTLIKSAILKNNASLKTFEIPNADATLLSKPSESKLTSKKEAIIIKKPIKEINDIIVKITKNSTIEDLKQAQKDLESEGIDFNYSKIDYNSDREITSIKIKYSDTKSGNSGSYHVDGDEDEPIKTIYIYRTEEGGIGIGNSPDGSDHKKHMELHKERMKEHAVRMKEHEARLEEHREKMADHRVKIHKEHEARLEEHHEKMAEHKAKAEETRETIIKERYNRAKKHRAEREILLEQRKEDLKNRKKEREEIIRLYKNNGDTKLIIRENKKGNDVNPIYVVDGKVVTKSQVSALKPDDISTINVLKDNSAVTLYGEEAENGVIQIVTKKNSSPSKVDYKVTSVVDLISDDNKHNKHLFTINKNTTNEELKSITQKLASKNIDLSVSRVKRNTKGEIYKIKIVVDDNKGSKSSSSYNTDDEGIPNIVLGKTSKGRVIISSSN